MSQVNALSLGYFRWTCFANSTCPPLCRRGPAPPGDKGVFRPLPLPAALQAGRRPAGEQVVLQHAPLARVGEAEPGHPREVLLVPADVGHLHPAGQITEATPERRIIRPGRLLGDREVVRI